MAIAIFLAFVILVLWLSFYFAAKTKSASGYFAAGGQIHWGVNGIAFAGDYLSAASFLGICGMIATKGYDGFLYSIGFLAGWIVALFVVAEPMKRLGKYTFTDALDSKFNSQGIKLAAAISTLLVSIFYLIPQMVGAGVLVEPLLGIPHYWGVIMVGAIVITIVATAGMTSTTYVQFLKGGLLIVFSSVLVICVLVRGMTTTPDQGGDVPFHKYGTNIPAAQLEGGDNPIMAYQATDGKFAVVTPAEDGLTFVGVVQGDDTNWYMGDSAGGKSVTLDDIQSVVEVKDKDGKSVALEDIAPIVKTEGKAGKPVTLIKRTEKGKIFVGLNQEMGLNWYLQDSPAGESLTLQEIQSVVETTDDEGKPLTIVNGKPKGWKPEDQPEAKPNELRQVGSLVKIQGKTGEEANTGSIGPLELFSILSQEDTVIQLWSEVGFKVGDGDVKDSVAAYYPTDKTGNVIMRPGQKFKVESDNWLDRVDFVSLMLALFCGTAALPHILIRYYTVPSPAAARKSTIVAIASIGFFYILTLYMGLGAMVSATVNLETSNMSAPLLAKSFGTFLFAIISAIAFATVLGTVSGLIVASSGAIAHDLMDRYMKIKMTDKQKVFAGKAAAFGVGIMAIILGILFRGMNVGFLVGWAFAIAASANLPAIIMLLFWKKTTAKGITASIIVGVFAAIGWILLSPDMFARYGLPKTDAIVPFSNPGIIVIPLSFITLVVVSLMTQKNGGGSPEEET